MTIILHKRPGAAVLRQAGRYENAVRKNIGAPGLQLQVLAEPIPLTLIIFRDPK